MFGPSQLLSSCSLTTSKEILMRQSKLTLAAMMLAGVMLLFVTGCGKAETSDSSDDTGDSNAAATETQPD